MIMTSLADMQSRDDESLESESTSGDEDTGEPCSTELFLTAVEYTTVENMPVTHLFGRDGAGKRHHIEVTGHRPSFYVRASEFTDRVANHYAVRDHESGYETLDGDNAVRVYLDLPEQVPDVRELFCQHYEADVLYGNRFLIDNGVTTGVKIALSNTRPTLCGGDNRVDVTDVSPCERPDVAPRVCTVDIEVASDSGFPSPDDADSPVVSIVAHDSYTDEYSGWLLWPDDNDVGVSDVCSQTHVFDDEDRLLDDFNAYVDAYEPDILTGWASNQFDYKYLISRCRNLSVWSYQQWSPLEQTYTTKYGPVSEGTVFVDMMGAYEKTQIHNLKDKSLDAIADKELGDTKLDVADSHADMWRDSPREFLEYNRVDVELVTRINEAAGCINLLTHIRDISGVNYDDPIGGNYEVMDQVFLRRSQEMNLCLPTSEPPDRNWYYGAYVFDTVGGLHKNVIYLDISSLYPSLIKQLNVSPEAMCGSEKPDGCYAKTYIDRRSDNVKKSDDPDMEPLYYEADTVGFIPSLVDELIEMKDVYRGTEKYEAVKRIVNSVYGVTSDADSYGKGFRLFDWRLGEGITLAGRLVIQECAKLAVEYLHDNGFTDAKVVVGDTDGMGIALESVNDIDEALAAGMDVEQHLNDALPSVSSELFEIDESDNEMQIECESYASKLVTVADTQKRYAKRVRWDEGDTCDEIEITGFEAIRSDVAEVTVDVQEKLFDLLLTKPLGEAIDEYGQYLRDVLQQIENGEYPLDKLGQTAGIGQPLDEYGSVDRTPQPQYRGAKYSNEHVYAEDAIGEGDRPLWAYVSRVRGLPRTYSADTAEDGQKVDAIAVLEADDLPDGVEIDTTKMCEKAIKDPVTDILSQMGYSYDSLIADTDQTDITDYW